MLLKEVGTNSKEELRTLMRDRDIWTGLSGVDRTYFRHSSTTTTSSSSSSRSRCQYFITDCEFKGDSQEIRTDLDKCGTTVSYNNTHVIYKNQVRIRYSTFTVIFVRY